MAIRATSAVLQRGHSSATKLGKAHVAVMVTCWFLAVIGSFFLLFNYNSRPGPSVELEQIPQRSSSERWTLIVGIHPKCSYSNATASELERLLRFIDERVDCKVLWFEPASSTRFGETAIVDRFSQIRGVEVCRDLDGSEMGRLKIATSGGAVLWDPTGTPQFAGGITPSRGHEGRSIGSDSIVRLVLGQPPTARCAPTYGCPIHDSASVEQPDGELI